MRNKELPDVDFLRECFTYDDGKLIWKVRPIHHFKNIKSMNRVNKLHAGKEAGGILKDGYKRLCISQNDYKLHRVIWKMLKGYLSRDIDVDHIDEDKMNCRIENLRLATECQNSANISITVRNTSGTKGISHMTVRKKFHYWYAETKSNGKRIGTTFPYTNQGLEMAKDFLKNKRLEAHGDFANNGIGCSILERVND